MSCGRKTNQVKPSEVPFCFLPVHFQTCRNEDQQRQCCCRPIRVQPALPLNHVPWWLGIWATLWGSPAVVSLLIQGCHSQKGIISNESCACHANYWSISLGRQRGWDWCRAVLERLVASGGGGRDGGDAESSPSLQPALLSAKCY